MNPAWIVRFRPTGPWRLGPPGGARDRVDRILRSDTLFSAVTIAFAQMGTAAEWLDATVRAPEPAVRFSSGFPFQGDTLFAPPPRSHWPPTPSPKVRWKGARFVPLEAIARVLSDQPLDEASWIVDGASECLLATGKGHSETGPFRTSFRASAAVDRMTGEPLSHSTACLEFARNSGIWAALSFASEEARDAWSVPLRGAFRLLADSGIGGERSRGWGRSEQPEIRDGALLELLSQRATNGDVPQSGAWWLLSLFTPSESDRIDWSRGSYSLLARSGRVESAAGWGVQKKSTRVLIEGSVVMADAPPRGASHDVAPEGINHPVYRCGLALAVPVPVRVAP